MVITTTIYGAHIYVLGCLLRAHDVCAALAQVLVLVAGKRPAPGTFVQCCRTHDDLYLSACAGEVSRRSQRQPHTGC